MNATPNETETPRCLMAVSDPWPTQSADFYATDAARHNAALERQIARYGSLNETITSTSLAQVAAGCRALVPAAKWLRLEWSDQGDWLSACEVIDADGTAYGDAWEAEGEEAEAEAQRIADGLTDLSAVSNLDERTRYVWEAYTITDPERPQEYLLDLDAAERAAEATGKHLHVGIDPRHLNAAYRALREVPGAPVDLMIDGDGWQVWGEPVGTDNNDDRTLHGIIATATEAQAVALALVLRAAGALTAMHDRAGLLLAVVTDAADWSEDQVTLTGHGLDAAALAAAAQVAG